MKTSDMPVLHVSGAPYARGRAQGEGLRDRVQAMCEGFQSELGLTDEQLVNRVNAVSNQTQLLQVTEQVCPELVEEWRGIAAGANQPYAAIVALNLLDELAWFEPRTETAPEHCSVFGVAREGQATLAQTMDLNPWTDGGQVLLIRSTEEQTVATFSVAGMTGLCGWNASGVAIAPNQVIQLQSRSDGLPVSAVIWRTLHEGRSLDAAVEALTTIPHASGQAYTVASHQGIATYECSARGQTRCVPNSQLAGRVAHTNHPLASDDLRLSPSSQRALAGDAPKLTRISASSRRRLARLEEALAGPDAGQRDHVKALLADRRAPISLDREPTNNGFAHTAGAMIYVCTPAGVDAEIAAGPPHLTDFQSFNLS